MITSPRRLVVVLLAAGCPFDPEDPQFETLGDTDDNGSSGSSSVDTTMTTSDPDTSGDPTTNPTTTTATTDPDDTGTTTDTAVCGDGQVEGDEVCDDRVNDGAYGGCATDCSALAPYCGDSETTDAEACDDGTNDGSYGGCTADCTALGPYCGDEEINGAEACDAGAANENGSGCNIDCVISGTVVGTFLEQGLDFCDGEFTTPPVFRDGSVLVSATGYCPEDSAFLAELSNDAVLVQVFDELLPDTPVREATLSGDDWVLGASNCSYALTPMGDYTEVCADDRIAGRDGMAARDDGSFVTLEYRSIASWPLGSPMNADTPDWSIVNAGDQFWEYYFSGVAIGASDSALVVGQRRFISNNTYSSYFARYTAAGNLVDSNSFGAVTSLAAIAVGGDGSIAVASGYPVYRVMKLDDNFDEEWTFDVSAGSDVLLDVDSVGAVVAAYYDDALAAGVIRKWSAEGAELWSVSGQVSTYNARLAIAPDDHIWVSAPLSGALAVVRVSP